VTDTLEATRNGQETGVEINEGLTDKDLEDIHALLWDGRKADSERKDALKRLIGHFVSRAARAEALRAIGTYERAVPVKRRR
jgi:hypothetical protein